MHRKRRLIQAVRDRARREPVVREHASVGNGLNPRVTKRMGKTDEIQVIRMGSGLATGQDDALDPIFPALDKSSAYLFLRNMATVEAAGVETKHAPVVAGARKPDPKAFFVHGGLTQIQIGHRLVLPREGVGMRAGEVLAGVEFGPSVVFGILAPGAFADGFEGATVALGAFGLAFGQAMFGIVLDC